MEQGSRHYASTRATLRLKLVALQRRPVEGREYGVFVGRPVVVVRRGAVSTENPSQMAKEVL